MTTQPALAGDERVRIATVSDLHLGLHTFGLLKTIREPEPGTDPGPHGDPPSVRCARAALAEAVAWGAELVVVKGDLTDKGLRSQWDTAAELLSALPVPVVVLPGNHDLYRHAEVDPVDAGREHGLHVVEGVEHIDLPGVRVVLAVTAIPGRSRGEIGPDLGADGRRHGRRRPGRAGDAPPPARACGPRRPSTRRASRGPRAIRSSTAWPPPSPAASSPPVTPTATGAARTAR